MRLTANVFRISSKHHYTRVSSSAHLITSKLALSSRKGGLAHFSKNFTPELKNATKRELKKF